MRTESAIARISSTRRTGGEILAFRGERWYASFTLTRNTEAPLLRHLRIIR
jgi:hypothetical protein